MIDQNDKQQDAPWLNEIRHKLSDLKPMLPPDGWEKISAELDAQSRHSHIPYWIRVVAVLLLVIFLGLWSLTEMPVIEDSLINEEPSITDNIPIINDATIEDPHDTPLVPGPAKPSLLRVAKVSLQQMGDTCEIAIQQTPQQHIDESVTAAGSEIEQLPNDEETSTLLAMTDAATRTQSRERHLRPTNIGLRLTRNGNINMIPNLDADDYQMVNPGGDMTFETPTPADSTAQVSKSLGSRPHSGTTRTDEVLSSDHHQSWSFGLSISRQVTDRLALESGLIYTLLTSDVTLSLSGKQHQQLHYLGLPLRLDYSLFKGERWQFYLAGGVILEHSLYGQRGEENLHLNDWQTSLNGALGLQYRVSSTAALYLEPGVSYYFDNGVTDVPSLRTEQPCSFLLQMGIRFSY